MSGSCSERYPVGGELAADVAATSPNAAAVFNSAGKLAVATDPYVGSDGVLFGMTLTAGEVASLFPGGRVAEAKAGEALTAGTDRFLKVGPNGRLYKLTAGARLKAIWAPRINENKAGVNAAAGDTIEVFLVSDRPRPWVGTATIDATDSTVNVTVDAAFNGAAVLVTPSGGFDGTATAFHGAVAGGILTITANAAATADTDVAFYIDGGN